MTPPLASSKWATSRSSCPLVSGSCSKIWRAVPLTSRIRRLLSINKTPSAASFKSSNARSAGGLAFSMGCILRWCCEIRANAWDALVSDSPVMKESSDECRAPRSDRAQAVRRHEESRQHGVRAPQADRDLIHRERRAEALVPRQHAGLQRHGARDLGAHAGRTD